MACASVKVYLSILAIQSALRLFCGAIAVLLAMHNPPAKWSLKMRFAAIKSSILNCLNYHEKEVRMCMLVSSC